MAVSSSPQPPILSPLRLTTTSSNLISFPPSLFLIDRQRRRSAIVFSSKSKNDMANDQKRALLESYGLDPDEFLSEPSPPKERRRKELQKTGRGKQVPAVERKPPRETHKLLQLDRSLLSLEAATMPKKHGARKGAGSKGKELVIVETRKRQSVAEEEEAAKKFKEELKERDRSKWVDSLKTKGFKVERQVDQKSLGTHPAVDAITNQGSWRKGSKEEIDLTKRAGRTANDGSCKMCSL